jgi:hypothetical protein
MKAITKKKDLLQIHISGYHGKNKQIYKSDMKQCFRCGMRYYLI